MNTVYEYTDIDRNVVVGTLQEIGEHLIRWHGANRLTDNRQPWLNLDQYGNVSDRDFTVDEWRKWASEFEDRPLFGTNLKQLNA